MTHWEEWSLPAAEVRLAQRWLPTEQADRLLEDLLAEVQWRSEEVRIYGRVHQVPRRVAWQGEPGTSYRYSGVEHVAGGWTPAACEIRDRLAAELQRDPFDAVLLNLYRDGQDSMGWHADDERELGPEPVIASVSLGATRTFRMRRCVADGHETAQRELAHGSLLLMSGPTQANWQHCVPRRTRVREPRVNLTFRDLSRRS